MTSSHFFHFLIWWKWKLSFRNKKGQNCKKMCFLSLYSLCYFGFDFLLCLFCYYFKLIMISISIGVSFEYTKLNNKSNHTCTMYAFFPAHKRPTFNFNNPLNTATQNASLNQQIIVACSGHLFQINSSSSIAI